MYGFNPTAGPITWGESLQELDCMSSGLFKVLEEDDSFTMMKWPRDYRTAERMKTQEN
jgi:hypothetical protein